MRDSDPIVQVGDPVLRAQAREVPVGDITTPRIQRIIRQMKEVLAAEPNGAAIAAPQIGVSLRIFVISRRILTRPDGTPASDDLVCVNPRIIKQARRKVKMDEGCLSVRGVYGYTLRAPRATIEAYNERAEKFVRGASGLLAQAFQHEIDHLNGTLFIDHALEVWEVPERETAAEEGLAGEAKSDEPTA